MEHCLVTGGAGFIGSHLCRRLVLEGAFVRVLDNLSTGKKSNLAGILDSVEFVEGDMGDEQTARRCMQGIDIVFHQGALPSVPRSVENPAATHRDCVDATFALLNAARNAKVKRFIYAASSSAYGDSPTLPKTESMAPNPLSPYAAAKLFGEYYCSVFSKVYGLETVSLRYFNVFGPCQDPKSQYAAAIPAFITSILNNCSPTIYGDGEQSRDFTYVENVVQANLLAAKAPKTAGEVINIACGRRITLNELVRLINRITGKNVHPTYAPPRPGDVRHSLADIRKAKEQLGYEPVVPFEEGLRRTIEWYKQNPL